MRYRMHTLAVPQVPLAEDEDYAAWCDREEAEALRRELANAIAEIRHGWNEESGIVFHDEPEGV